MIQIWPHTNVGCGCGCEALNDIDEMRLAYPRDYDPTTRTVADDEPECHGYCHDTCCKPNFPCTCEDTGCTECHPERSTT